MLRRMMRGLAFTFTQAFSVFGIALAQNAWYEPGCLDDPANPTMCVDNGCELQGGQCYPQVGVGPDGQITQGCVCVPDFPTPVSKACLHVIDSHTGAMMCMDLNCPPTHDFYDCDPITCRCPAQRVFQDPQARCTVSLFDPTACMDFGCAAAGGVCRPIEAQGPNGQELGGCECVFPAQPPVTCGTYMSPVGLLGCYDVGCGSTIDYECLPAGCGCTCVGIIPSPDLTIRWLTKVEMIWTGTGSRCSAVYNLYRMVAPRLPDLNRNGVADTYGPCYYHSLVAKTATDNSIPPPGVTQFYMVTAESTAGEGSMGTASNGLLRPNLTPCPTPPPPFP